ncbi:MAG: serpin family protein [Gemmataceae bacterium]|nr:serpin family protein [Gemmataceae bacterium]
MAATKPIRADFAARLFGALAAAEPDRNLFVSPFSIDVALAMCAAGARGATRLALAELLGAPGDAASQNRRYAERIAQVQAAGGADVRLTIANALWRQTGLNVRAEFARDVAENYGGAFHEVDFQAQPEAAVATINAWVKRQTADKITELLRREHIDKATRLLATNAIHFHGAWQRAFDPADTCDDAWHGCAGTRTVPMMRCREGFLYYENDAVQALEIPYRGQRLCLLIVLPKQTDGLEVLQRDWADGKLLDDILARLRLEKNVLVTLPRFTMTSEFALKPVLVQLGAGAAFSDQADFSGITDEPLPLSDVIHKAFVQVNEAGTEAAAATGVVMAKSAMSIDDLKIFRADHPFLFVIRDRLTHVVLFQGRLCDPN